MIKLFWKSAVLIYVALVVQQVFPVWTKLKPASAQVLPPVPNPGFACHAGGVWENNYAQFMTPILPTSILEEPSQHSLVIKIVHFKGTEPPPFPVNFATAFKGSTIETHWTDEGLFQGENSQGETVAFKFSEDYQSIDLIYQNQKRYQGICRSVN